jgi:hypothetical protein
MTSVFAVGQTGYSGLHVEAGTVTINVLLLKEAAK